MQHGLGSVEGFALSFNGRKGRKKKDGSHEDALPDQRPTLLVLLTPAGGEGYFKECSVPASTMTLPPPAELSYSEIEKLLAVGTKYGIEFVLPKP